MAKSKTTKTNPRMVGRGSVVKIKGTDVDEVVRSVSIVLHLANGQDVVYTHDEEIDVLDSPDLSVEEIAAKVTGGLVIEQLDYVAPPAAVEPKTPAPKK